MPTTQSEIRSYWTKLTDCYIVNLPGFGKIIRHADKVNTVESTRDEEFLEVLRKAVPEQELEAWFHIFDAAPMVKTNPNSCR